MMHLRGLVLVLLFLPGFARRSIRLGGSHYDAQQRNNMLANGLEVSAQKAKQTLIPGGAGTGVFRRAGPKEGASEPNLVAPWFRFGPHHTEVDTEASDGAAVRAGVPQMISKARVPNKNVWVDLLKGKDVPPGSVNTGFRYGQEIAIVNEKGTLYAISNKLPPTAQPATFGTLEGDGTIKEPISGTKFSLRTGKVVGPWCPSLVGKIAKLLIPPTDVPTFQVRKNGDSIQVKINVNAKAQFEQNYWRGVLDAQGKVDGGYY